MMFICPIEPNYCGLSFYFDDLLDVKDEVEGGGQVSLDPGLDELHDLEDDQGGKITRGHSQLGLRGGK